jgi:ubiquinone/menaquinone biosynthesis C-methylase UbiE
MNQFSYYSGLDQMAKRGIEGKTFAEIGCGPCPMGEKLVARGAKKIYGLDISSEMIENARNDLTKKGIIDKFDLVCADISDHDFELAEKVDCVVFCYCITTFVNNFDKLREILIQAKKLIKEDGYVCVVDFSYYPTPTDMVLGYENRMAGDHPPKNWEIFHFKIDICPTDFEIFQIPAEVLLQAALEAGFKNISYTAQYPNPKYENNEQMKLMLEFEFAPKDFVFIMSNQEVWKESI